VVQFPSGSHAKPLKTQGEIATLHKDGLTCKAIAAVRGMGGANRWETCGLPCGACSTSIGRPNAEGL